MCNGPKLDKIVVYFQGTRQTKHSRCKVQNNAWLSKYGLIPPEEVVAIVLGTI